ncbi:hypothetical protein BHM03_00002058 [Ensete ventricosum]|nr:hypothetical protein BHM03_00002058 [Ensete ventricosum]
MNAWLSTWNARSQARDDDDKEGVSCQYVPSDQVQWEPQCSWKHEADGKKKRKTDQCLMPAYFFLLLITEMVQIGNGDKNLTSLYWLSPLSCFHDNDDEISRSNSSIQHKKQRQEMTSPNHQCGTRNDGHHAFSLLVTDRSPRVPGTARNYRSSGGGPAPPLPSASDGFGGSATPRCPSPRRHVPRSLFRKPPLEPEEDIKSKRAKPGHRGEHYTSVVKSQGGDSEGSHICSRQSKEMRRSA